MNFVFLCHAPADREDAGVLGDWLERNSPWEVRYAECGAGAPHDLIEAVEQAMSAAAVIVLLSAESVPERWVRARWEPVLLEAPADSGVPLAFLELRACKVPELLRRRTFFDASLAGRRALKRWLLEARPSVTELPAGAAAIADSDLENLRRELADEAGGRDQLPPAAALAFARRCEADFEGVIWLDCARRTDAGVYGDLAHALGLRLSGTVEENAQALREFCATRRLLLVFHNHAGSPFPREGKCSVIRTAPGAAPAPRPASELARLFANWPRNESECLGALRDLSPALASGAPWPDLRALIYSAVALLRHRERAAELLELVDEAVALAQTQGDEAALRHVEWERGWIRESWGRVEAVVAPVLPPAPGDQLTLQFPMADGASYSV